MEQFGLIGWPIAHSLSPVIHNAGFLAEGLPHHYELIPIEPEKFHADIADVLTRYSGLNVTTPYKQAIIPYVDELTETAAKIQAVNTIYKRADGTIVGDSTDGPGFWASSGIGANQQVVLIGCGGAARAIMATIPKDVHVQILNRHSPRFNDYQDIVATLTQTQLQPLEAFTAWQNVDVVIDATSQGLNNDVSILNPAQMEQLPKHTKLIDLKYRQTLTPFLQAGQANGHPIMDGKPMLLGQAVLSHQSWIQAPPADDSMMKALVAHTQD